MKKKRNLYLLVFLDFFGREGALVVVTKVKLYGLPVWILIALYRQSILFEVVHHSVDS